MLIPRMMKSLAGLVVLFTVTTARVLPDQYGYQQDENTLGPNFDGMNQAPYQESAGDEDFQTLVRAGGPYSGTYAQESLLEDQDIVGYMSMPSQMEDIPIVAAGHDIGEHNRMLHEPAETSHLEMDPDDDAEAVALQHDQLVDKSIHGLSGINVNHDEAIHRHVHPDDDSRIQSDLMNGQKFQQDQKGFEHKLDQLTWKINSEKEAKHYGESQFELSSAQPGDRNHVAEGMPFEVLLKGGSYYDSIGRHSYITSSTAITLGALIGIIFLLCGFLLAIVYCKTGWSLTDMLCESEMARGIKIQEVEAIEPEMVPCCECPEDRQIRPRGWRNKKRGARKPQRPKPSKRAAGDSEGEAMTADDVLTPGSEY